MNISALQTLIFQEAGSEYRRINVSETQFQSIIVPRALKWFAENHDDGTRPDIYELSLTANTYEYTLDSNILYVVGYYPESIGFPISRRKYVYEREVSFADDLISYSYSNAYFSQLQISTGFYFDFNYNPTTNVFSLKNLEDQTKIYLDVFVNETYDNPELIYENHTFQKLVLGHTLIQWGRNLNKFSSEILGGRAINWQEIKEEGEQIIEQVYEEVENKYSEEPEWLFG